MNGQREHDGGEARHDMCTRARQTTQGRAEERSGRATGAWLGRGAASPTALVEALAASGPTTRSRAVAELQRSRGNVFVQRLLAVQREDEDEGFDLSLLPPELRVPLGPLDLSATTSAATLGYQQGPLSSQLGFGYGGDIFARAAYGDFSGGLSANPGAGSVNASLAYGNPLLPMPAGLSSSVYGAEAGARGVLAGLPGMFQDPLGAISEQSGNISSIAGTAGMLSGVAGAQEGFGAGVQFGYDPEKWSLMAGAQYVF